jgi:CheY-like chemotaxis protein/two-component sensor histidine kinase
MDGPNSPSEDAPQDAPQDARGNAVAETLQLFSHDIRAAMSDVVGGLRLIDLERLDPETRMQFDRVRAAGDTLAALVDGALMAAAGETLIKRDEDAVTMRDWLAALNGRWSGRAREAETGFGIDLDGHLPVAMRIPQVTLDRIVGNLVGNAFRHAQGGEVRLRLRGRRGNGLIIQVRDTGPGYPAAVLSRMRRGVDPAPIGQRAGSGLGLRIAAELTRQVSGELILRNDPRTGGGEATLHLPEAVVDWAGAPAQPCEPPDLGGLRLLVAEDNLTNQTILKQLLAKMKAEAVFVADGDAALERLTDEEFDVALIDIEMPRKSGLEVMTAVRALGGDKAAMPLIALTAYVLRDNREAIYDAGADGIIGKPISSGADFGRAILRYAGRPTDGLEPEAVLGGLYDDGAQSAAGPAFDAARFDALMDVAGEEGRGELLSRLHEDLAQVCAELDAGVLARSVPVIRAQTHILIAISGAVGAERLNQLAEVLNIAAKRQRLEDLEALYAPCRRDLLDLIARVDATAEAYCLPVA